MITFQGFNHDVVTIKNDKLALLPNAKIIKAGPETSDVVPYSWLDHIYCHPNVICKGTAHPVTSASDHVSIQADITF